MEELNGWARQAGNRRREGIKIKENRGKLNFVVDFCRKIVFAPYKWLRCGVAHEVRKRRRERGAWGGHRVAVFGKMALKSVWRTKLYDDKMACKNPLQIEIYEVYRCAVRTGWRWRMSRSGHIVASGPSDKDGKPQSYVKRAQCRRILARLVATLNAQAHVWIDGSDKEIRKHAA